MSYTQHLDSILRISGADAWEAFQALTSTDDVIAFDDAYLGMDEPEGPHTYVDGVDGRHFFEER